MRNQFARFGLYTRFILRRERIMSPVWTVCIAGFAALFAAVYPALLKTPEDIQQMAVTMSLPSMTAMMGKVYGLDNLSQASLMAPQCLIWLMITAAVMNIFLINRHTRADEELGRLEMLRALPVGRLTGSTAAIHYAFCLNVLIALLTAVFLCLVDIGGMTFKGALVYGSAIGVSGFLFAALTLLAAQLFSTARGVSGFGFAVLILFYMMRAVGDAEDNALSWISPMGLVLKAEAFYKNDFIPILIVLAEGLVLAAAAFWIGAVRDHGMGVLPARRGRARASRFLGTPAGFAWRLTRGPALSWGAVTLLLGASYGSLCTNLSEFIQDNEMMQKMLGTNDAGLFLDNYVSMIFAVMSMLCAVPAVTAVLKLHGEEKRGRLEQIAALSVSRWKLYGSFTALSVLGSAVMTLLLAAGLGLASGGALSLGPLIKASLCYLPAIWVMTGLAALLLGCAPKLSGLVWAMFGYTFIMMYFGRVLDIPDWAVRLTPFGNIPQLPVQDFTAAPLAVLTLIAAVLTGLGGWRFARRDIG